MKKRDKRTHREAKEIWSYYASLLSGETGEAPTPEEIIDKDELSTLAMHWGNLKMMGKRTAGRPAGTNEAWEKVYDRLKTDNLIKKDSTDKRIRHPGYSLLVKVAAVVLLAAGIGWGLLNYFNRDYNETIMVFSGDEKNITIELPDGSSAVLNRNTRLTYDTTSTSSTREVTLSGEAIFDVRRDTARPFTVITDKAQVKVLGTIFVVNTNAGINDIEVAVTQGKILLTDNEYNDSIIIDEGFIGTRVTGITTTHPNINRNYLAWNTDILVYEDESLKTVLKDLERTYGIKVIANDELISEMKITTVFENIPQEDIINIICTTFNLNYSKTEGVYVLSQ